MLEDDMALRLVLTSALEQDGHGVLQCGTNEDALSCLTRCNVELLVLDLMVGNSTSLSVASFAAHAVPSAEVIIVTGSDHYPHGELHAQSQNISWSLRKPIRMEDLRALAQYAEHRRVARLGSVAPGAGTGQQVSPP
ncbi:MAG: hypothetical protein AB8B85_06410 [Paracoccaceae bacterium]